MYDNIKRISIVKTELYELTSPIVCHGYAGTLLILLTAYKYKEDEVLRNKILELVEILLKEYRSDSLFGYQDVETTYVDGQYAVKYIDKNSFLEGTSGIVLVLLSLIKRNTRFEICLQL
ncbi:lanthionine synthetase LanC family protein [Anaerotignum sp.]|uniref:lanthionine synthetase LanC family protein n=1 Tax=Anaerotignum sp. TaxID=2039241 RepID=UPI0028987305|nr:lanthionine synthetase LanC family protein [Anaerotignum sp.]